MESHLECSLVKKNGEGMLFASTSFEISPIALKIRIIVLAVGPLGCLQPSSGRFTRLKKAVQTDR